MNRRVGGRTGELTERRELTTVTTPNRHAPRSLDRRQAFDTTNSSVGQFDLPGRLTLDAPIADSGSGEDPTAPRDASGTSDGLADDQALMAAIRGGDEGALQRLRDRHSPLLRAIVADVLPCEADVEETVQDIFLEIWRLAANYDPARGKPLGWIVRMARRRAIDRHRKNAVRFRLRQQLEAEAQAADRAHGSGSRPGGDESPAGLSDLRHFLARLLQSLPHAQREALELNFFGQLSQREIARRTGIPLGTIKTRVVLALKKLAHLTAAYDAELR